MEKLYEQYLNANKISVGEETIFYEVGSDNLYNKKHIFGNFKDFQDSYDYLEKLICTIIGFGNYSIYIKGYPSEKIVNMFQVHKYNISHDVKCSITGDVIKISSDFD